MDNIIAIGLGLALRSVIDIVTDSDYRLTGTLVGLWEGFVLSHFLHKNPRNPNDAYLALATRFVIDFLLTNSLVRFALTGAWTLVGLLLADVAPSVLRETGLRHVYRALRKDVKAMRRSMPRWRIENDIQVPNISISNRVPDLLSSRPSSSIVSSTRAAPPASPTPILQRRSTSNSPSSRVTSSVTNTLTREVVLGPSPALIHIDVDPEFPPSFNPDTPSPRSSLLSNTSDSSRHDQAIPIQDDDRVHTAVPSHMQEQEQEQGADLSVLDLTPPVAAVGITFISEIISPTPRSYPGGLPLISDSEIDLSVHAPPVLPLESRPASRIRNLSSTFGAGISNQNTGTGVREVGKDRGPDIGRSRTPPHQRASSAGVSAQNKPTFGNQPNSTGHSSKWEHSRLRHPEQTILSDGAAGIGGFAIRPDAQMPQHSGTPQAHPGSDGVHMSSVLGLSTPLSPPKILATLPDLAPQIKPPTPAPLVKPPTPAPLTKPPTPAPLTTPAPALPSKTATPAPLSRTHTPMPPTKPPTPAPLTTPAPALPSKTPTPAPLSRTHTPMPTSKISTPKPKSRCTSPGLTSTSVRNHTDYDPANPIRPMPGLKSPSTDPDPIFPDVGARNESTTGVFNPLDTNGADIYDPPPPFKEFESPVHPRGANFGAGIDDGKRTGEQVTGGSQGQGAVAEPPAAQGDAKGEEEGEKAITNTNIGNVGDVGGQDSGEGTKENIQTSNAGDHARVADSPNREEGAGEKGKDSQEQEKNEQDGEGNQGAVGQATCEDANLASGDTQVAGDDTQDTEPVRLTPAQEKAETYRNDFLRKEVTRLEESREKLGSSDAQDLSKIQARLSVIKERISKKVFADPPKYSSSTLKVPTAGKTVPEIRSDLTDAIVDFLLKRQDADPIEVPVLVSKNKHKTLDKPLKEFVTENDFSISDHADGQYVITV